MEESFHEWVHSLSVGLNLFLTHCEVLHSPSILFIEIWRQNRASKCVNVPTKKKKRARSLWCVQMQANENHLFFTMCEKLCRGRFFPRQSNYQDILTFFIKFFTLGFTSEKKKSPSNFFFTRFTERTSFVKD